MSPHERRRLEKKRRLVLKHNKGSDPHGNSSFSLKGTAVNTAVLNGIKYSLEEPLEDRGINETDREQRDEEEMGVEDSSTESSAEVGKRKPLGEVVCVSSDSYEHGIIAQESGESSLHLRSDQGSCSKRTNRLSLLGHGHHGKEVVDRLLKEQGEDGIREFCQKWRQVFVEAVNPRFLPAGWDIMHSGRRDFGDYSVYNPAKKLQHPATKK